MQQMWTLRLKTRLSEQGNGNANFNGNYNRGNPNSNRRVKCYRFNRGKCSFGSNCKFDHKCGICGKRGHGAWNCRKLIQDNNNRNGQNNNNNHEQGPPRMEREAETGEKRKKLD